MELPYSPDKVILVLIPISFLIVVLYLFKFYTILKEVGFVSVLKVT